MTTDRIQSAGDKTGASTARPPMRPGPRRPAVNPDAAVWGFAGADGTVAPQAELRLSRLLDRQATRGMTIIDRDGTVFASANPQGRRCLWSLTPVGIERVRAESEHRIATRRH